MVVETEVTICIVVRAFVICPEFWLISSDFVSYHSSLWGLYSILCQSFVSILFLNLATMCFEMVIIKCLLESLEVLLNYLARKLISATAVSVLW